MLGLKSTVLAVALCVSPQLQASQSKLPANYSQARVACLTALQKRVTGTITPRNNIYRDLKDGAGTHSYATLFTTGKTVKRSFIGICYFTIAEGLSHAVIKSTD